jgi:hypothetical protein
VFPAGSFSEQVPIEFHVVGQAGVCAANRDGEASAPSVSKGRTKQTSTLALPRTHIRAARRTRGTGDDNPERAARTSSKFPVVPLHINEELR